MRCEQQKKLGVNSMVPQFKKFTDVAHLPPCKQNDYAHKYPNGQTMSNISKNDIVNFRLRHFTKVHPTILTCWTPTSSCRQMQQFEAPTRSDDPESIKAGAPNLELIGPPLSPMNWLQHWNVWRCMVIHPTMGILTMGVNPPINALMTTRYNPSFGHDT